MIIQRNRLICALIMTAFQRLYIQITELRRVMRITLTEASYKVIDKVNVAYEQCRQILTEGVSEEELQVFRRVIRQMNDNVNGELE